MLEVPLDGHNLRLITMKMNLIEEYSAQPLLGRQVEDPLSDQSIRKHTNENYLPHEEDKVETLAEVL
jgi:hypothetical protein